MLWLTFSADETNLNARRETYIHTYIYIEFGNETGLLLQTMAMYLVLTAPLS